MKAFYAIFAVTCHAFIPSENKWPSSKSMVFLSTPGAITSTFTSFSTRPSQLLMSSSEADAAPEIVGGVVITGAAGGVGFAYAGEFMNRGYDVVICDVKDCSSAAAALAKRHTNGTVYHTICDVSDSASVEKLGAFAQEKMGTIAYWINNAGINGGRRDLRDVSFKTVEAVVKVSGDSTMCQK